MQYVVLIWRVVDQPSLFVDSRADEIDEQGAVVRVHRQQVSPPTVRDFVKSLESGH
jgi:hypothetical protein